MVQSLFLLEIETGYAFTGGAFEYFWDSFSASTRLVPYFTALKCADQAFAISSPILLQLGLILANTTSSQIGTSRAFDELQCGGKLLSCSWNERIEEQILMLMDAK
jgi:hypothetical protein